MAGKFLNEEPKKTRNYKKVGLLFAGSLAVISLCAAVWWFLLRPADLDKGLVENAIVAIDSEDQAALSAVAAAIQGTRGYEQHPEYVTILVINAVRSEDLDAAGNYLNKLKSLGNFSYAGDAPWKDRDSMITSLEHDVEFLRTSKEAVFEVSSGGG